MTTAESTRSKALEVYASICSVWNFVTRFLVSSCFATFCPLKCGSASSLFPERNTVLNFVSQGVNYNPLILIEIIFDSYAVFQFKGLVTGPFPAIETLVSACLHICE